MFDVWVIIRIVLSQFAFHHQLGALIYQCFNVMADRNLVKYIKRSITNALNILLAFFTWSGAPKNRRCVADV